MIYSYLVNLIGQVPEGLQDAVYVFAMIVCLFLLAELFAFLHNVFRSVSQM